MRNSFGCSSGTSNLLCLQLSRRVMLGAAAFSNTSVFKCSEWVSQATSIFLKVSEKTRCRVRFVTEYVEVGGALTTLEILALPQLESVRIFFLRKLSPLSFTLVVLFRVGVCMYGESMDGSMPVYCIVLYCIVLYCIVLYCIVLYCIVLFVCCLYVYLCLFVFAVCVCVCLCLCLCL
jgi:hypothetical protein